MHNVKEKMIEKIETRLQFVVVILVFFLSIFPNSLVSGSILIVAYIIDYIFFAKLGDRLNEKHLKWLNNMVLIGIASYIIPLTLMALSTQKGTIPLWQGYTLMGVTYVSIFLMIWIPVIILVMLLFLGINWKKSFRF
jgi:hypothetical protein